MREDLVQAFDLMAATGWVHFTLAELSESKGMPLNTFSSRMNVWERLFNDLDQHLATVLLEGEPRDKLFDIVMSRFEYLQPIKGTLVKATFSLLEDPLALSKVLKLVHNSLYTMIPLAGFSHPLKIEALILSYGYVCQTWANDESTDLSETMVAVDSLLENLQDLQSRFLNVGSFTFL